MSDSNPFAPDVYKRTAPFDIVHVDVFSFPTLEKRALPADLTVVKAAELVFYEGEAFFS